MSGDTMSSFISALTDTATGITGSSLWGNLSDAVPLIVLVFGFAFGLYIIRRVVKGGSKGKMKI